MNPRKKTILLKDQSKLLFFAWQLLQKLNNSQYSIYTKMDNGNREFLCHFPEIKHIENGQKIDLIVNIISKNEDGQKPDTLNYIINKGSSNTIDPQDTEDFFDLIDSYFAHKDFNLKSVLVTAGPTIEDIDPVRFLTNRSTGKMGIAIARTAFIRGASVKIIIGPSSEKIPGYLDIIKVRSAAEMNEVVMDQFRWCDYFFASSAVADYTPLKKFENKMKKGSGNLQIEMKRTQDILQNVKKIKEQKQKVIGFSVDTRELIENSRKKLIRKELDLIVANNPNIKGAGFAAETNQVELVSKTDYLTLPLLSKKETAHRILDHVLKISDKNSNA